MDQQKKYDVFISYSRKDSAIADEICQAFDSVGITYFIDRKGMGGTANYVTKIAEEIDNSKAMLLLASANSYKSKYVSIELHYAFNHDVVVLPYALDETPVPKDFEILLIHANWHYFSKDPIIPTLLTSVSELVGKDITDKITQAANEENTLQNVEQQPVDDELEINDAHQELDLVNEHEKDIIEESVIINSIEVPDTESKESTPKPFKKARVKKILQIIVSSIVCIMLIFGTILIINRKTLRYEYDYTNKTATVIRKKHHFHIFDYAGNIKIPAIVKHRGEYFHVQCIGESAFSICRGLTSITIPNSVTSIAELAFFGCRGLTSITIPNSVTSIGHYTFSRCSRLTSITIPNSMTSISNVAFSNCDGLTSIIVEKGNKTYDSRENCNAIIETASNTLIAGCKNTVIPNSVTSIGYYAFSNCDGLTSVTIPNSVTSIGESAFYSCSYLTSVTIPNSVTSIGDKAFYYCSRLTSIIIPNSVTSIGEEAFDDCDFLESITIPKSLTDIGKNAFPEHTKIIRK